jgi:chemotaxis protein MotB
MTTPTTRRLVLAAMGAFMTALLSGCVTSKTHEALLRDHEQTKGALSDCEGALAGCRGTVGTLERDKASALSDVAALKESNQDMARALETLRAREAESKRRMDQFKDLLARFKPLIDAGKLRVKMVAGRMVVELPSDVLFKSGTAHLGKDGKAAIEEVTAVLVSVPDKAYQVEGHTDDVPIKKDEFPSNWELASARALTVVHTMLEAGMPPGRISAASYSEHRPAVPNESPEGRQANRRIEIVVQPDLTGLPGFEELNRLGE